MKNYHLINAGLSQIGVAQKPLAEAQNSFTPKEKIMKNLRSILTSLIGLLVVFQLAFVASVAAQTQRRSDSERLQRVMNPFGNTEEFRQELTNYFTELEEVSRLFNQIPVVRQRLYENNLKPLSIIAQAKLSIANATPEELRQMREVYAKFPGWRDTAHNMNALIKPAYRQQLEARLAAKGGDFQVEAVTPDNCADGINADVSNTDIAAARTAVIAAAAFQEVIPPPLNAIAVAATAAAEGIALSLETLKAIKDDCTALDATAVGTIVNAAKTDIINNSNTNKDFIINNDNSNKTMLTTSITNAQTAIINNDNSNKTALTTAITSAQTSINNTTNASSTAITTAITNAQTAIINTDNSNKTMIVNNDNANATTLNTNLTNAKNAIITNDNTNTTNIVNNDNANKTELRDLLLRTQIEADLAEADNATYVGLYVTPTANGGHLDLVRAIVVDTIAKLAGANTAQANALLAQADAFKAAGNYKSAYQYYRKAYKAAVN
ncbi:MAG TPA: hypothetical protein VFZ34_32350 [Blastocatellia bacterium]|nr:hypothetical protein [Blastocatellia bacterium]